MRPSRCACIAATPSISSPKTSRFFSLFVAIGLSPTSLNAPSLTGFPFRIDRPPHAQTAALPLAACLVAPAQFPESTGTRHDLPGFRVVNQRELKRQQSCVVEVRAEMARKGRRLEKLHRLEPYAKCVWFGNVGRRPSRSR